MRAPSVRRGAATAAGWSTVAVVVVVSVGIVVIPVVVAGVLRKHTRHQILYLRKHLLFAGLEVQLAALHTFRHIQKLVCKKRLVRCWSDRFLVGRWCSDAFDRDSVGTRRRRVEVLHLLVCKTGLFLKQALSDNIGHGGEIGLLGIREHRASDWKRA